MFYPNEQRGGWGVGYVARRFSFVLVSLFSRPRAGLATVPRNFFGLATNMLNVRNNNNYNYKEQEAETIPVQNAKYHEQRTTTHQNPTTSAHHLLQTDRTRTSLWRGHDFLSGASVPKGEDPNNPPLTG